MIRFNTLKRRSMSALAAAAVAGALLAGVAGTAPASAARLYPPGPTSPATAAESIDCGVIINEATGVDGCDTAQAGVIVHDGVVQAGIIVNE
jgi:hypothetical protein